MPDTVDGYNCIVHGKIVGEIVATEINSALLFQLYCTNPSDPSIGLTNGVAPSFPFELDTGDFELALSPMIAERLQLPNLGQANVSGVAGSTDQAYYTRVIVSSDKASPIPFSWACNAVVIPGMGTSLFGRRAVAMRGLGMITEGIPPKTPSDYLSFQGYTRIAFYEGVGYQGPTDPSNVTAG